MVPPRSPGSMILPLRTCSTRTGAPLRSVVNKVCGAFAGAAAAVALSRKVICGLSKRSASMVTRPRNKSTKSSETLASLATSVCTAGKRLLSLISSWPRTETSGRNLTRTGPVNLTSPPVQAESSAATRSPKRDVSPISQGMSAITKIRTASRPKRSHFHRSWLGFMPSTHPLRRRPQMRDRGPFRARPKPEDVLARLTGDSEPGAGIY